MVTVELRVDAPAVDPELAARLVVGDWVNLWSRDDFERVNIYARRTCGGQGLIGTITKTREPVLAKYWQEATATIESVNGQHVVLMIVFRAEDSEFPEHGN